MTNVDYSLKVINLSGSSSIAGRLIKVNPSRSNSFMLLGNNETNMLGVIVEGGISSGLLCGIKVNGAAYVFINGVVKQGDRIRSLKTGDAGSKGTAMAVRLSDVTYLQVGFALESGSSKMILVALNVAYVSPTTSLGWGAITGTPTTIAGYGITDHNHMGGAVHYTTFESDGTMVMNGDATVWDDSQASAGLFTTGVSSLTLDTLVGGIKQYRFDVNDEIHIPATQFSHSLQLNSQISPHLHIINKVAIGASPQNIKFEFEWAWVNVNGKILASANDPLNFDVGGLDALTHKMLVFTPISPVGDQGGISSLFMARLKRVTADSDAYNTANIFTGGFDVHFLKDTIGSRLISTK